MIRHALGLVRYGLTSVKQMVCIYSNSLLLGEACHEVLQGALNYHIKLFSEPVMSTPIARMRAY